MRQGEPAATIIAARPEPARGASILIVDDDEAGREALRRHLKHKGFSTLAASDAPSAMEIVLAHQPDLLLLDVMMPQISGMDPAGKQSASASGKCGGDSSSGRKLDRSHCPAR